MAERSPSLAEIEALAGQALAALPAEFRDQLGPIVFRVEDFADDDTLDAMGIDDPFDLLGLYRGVALPQKSTSDPLPGIDMIYLYRRPILDFWCDSGDDLFDVVRHVLVHEIGHHFGFSDDDMARIEEVP